LSLSEIIFLIITGVVIIITFIREQKAKKTISAQREEIGRLNQEIHSLNQTLETTRQFNRENIENFGGTYN